MATNPQACLQHGAVQAVPPRLWGMFCCSCVTACVPHRAFPSPSHRAVPETLVLLLPAAPSPSPEGPPPCTSLNIEASKH